MYTVRHSGQEIGRSASVIVGSYEPTTLTDETGLCTELYPASPPSTNIFKHSPKRLTFTARGHARTVALQCYGGTVATTERQTGGQAPEVTRSRYAATVVRAVLVPVRACRSASPRAAGMTGLSSNRYCAVTGNPPAFLPTLGGYAKASGGDWRRRGVSKDAA